MIYVVKIFDLAFNYVKICSEDMENLISNVFKLELGRDY